MKSDLSDYQAPVAFAGQRHRKLSLPIKVVSVLLIYVLGLQVWLSYTKTSSGPTLERKPFQWSDIQPSKLLDFTPCYGPFQCAKLELPLDYWNGTHPGKTVSIAIAKLPARVPVTDPRYGGPLLLNPGGPGGSGVGFALGAGGSIQSIVDSAVDPEKNAADSRAKYYDILGFDPRGVQLSEPHAACFHDPATAWSWLLREQSEGILRSSDAALGRLWSMNHAFGSSCNQSMEEEGDIKQYLTTASVARDMLEIIERHDALVADKLLQDYYKKLGPIRIQGDLPELLEMMLDPEHPKTAKLHYWGFSYGTYLGSTFAAMFPDRVGRLVLDGVVDAEDYTKTFWFDNLNDTEKVMNSFYTTCSALGFPKCPLAAPTPAEVQLRVKAILTSLYHNPLPVILDAGPEVITYSDIRILIFGTLYTPSLAFPFLAKILAALEQQDGMDLARGLQMSHVYRCTRNDSGVDFRGIAAGTAILCSDGDDQTSLETSKFSEYIDDLTGLSPTAGDVWASIRLKCTGWPIRPLYRFRGPWKAETANPILFIGNSADPVTPVGAARKMSRGFGGSRVLQQNSAGHCSLSASSICTAGHVKAYFQDGALPEEGTVCEVDSGGFGKIGEEEVEVLGAMRGMREWMVRNPGWMFGRDAFDGRGLRRDVLTAWMSEVVVMEGGFEEWEIVL